MVPLLYTSNPLSVLTLTRFFDTATVDSIESVEHEFHKKVSQKPHGSEQRERPLGFWDSRD